MTCRRKATRKHGAAIVVWTALACAACAAAGIQGHVYTPGGQPLQGAVVALRGTDVRDTTDAAGAFGLATAVLPRTAAGGRTPDVRVGTHGLVIRSALSGPLAVTFHSPCGRVIGKVEARVPGSGSTTVAYPRLCARQVVVARVETAEGHRSVRLCAGPILAAGNACPSQSRPVAALSGPLTENRDTLDVSHPAFEDLAVPVPASGGPMEIFMRYGRLTLYHSRSIGPKDTLANSAEGMLVWLDSLYVTDPCTCTVGSDYCRWGGMARFVVVIAQHQDTVRVALSIAGSQSGMDTLVERYLVTVHTIGSARCDSPDRPAFVTITIGRSPEGTRPHLFVEDWTTVDGEVVSGGDCPRYQIDFPTYWYSAQERTLSGHMPFAINDSLIAILGAGLELRNAAGGGAASGLSPVYRVPAPGRDSLTILEIAQDGRLTVAVGADSFVLSPDSVWRRVTVADDTSHGCVVRKTTTRTVSNYGFLPNEQIRQSLW